MRSGGATPAPPDTRTAIVSHAVDVASVDGLEGLTIGRLAGDLEMSKAGVIGHFGSKQGLQRAVLAEAIEVFAREVFAPARAASAGLPRLLAICEAWVGYLERGVFPGGCFLTAAACEFDGRPGPVRDEIAAAITRWASILTREARRAVDAGDLPAGTDPAQVAFELNAVAMGANQALQLQTDPAATDRARAAMRRALGRSQDG